MARQAVPSSAENDVFRSPPEVDILLRPTVIATALASQMQVGERINETDFNQNYTSSMFPVPFAGKWSGHEVKSPNLTNYTPEYPKPSDLANFFAKQLEAIQSQLSGSQ